MTDNAPDRIWAKPEHPDENGYGGFWIKAQVAPAVEYIRADLYTALVAERDRLAATVKTLQDLDAISVETVQPYRRNPMSDKEFAERAALILHNMALENMGWRGWFRRWYISDEPLRADAANLIIASGRMLKRHDHTRYVGETP